MNKKFGYWRDTHIRVEGTSVYMLQMIFLTDWYYTTKEILLTKRFFPKIADHKIVNTASYSYFSDILKSGGKVYLYTKGFIHSKVIIIDDKITSTGSANMDLRSFMLNFEINAFIYDKEVIDIMTKDFLEDMKNSEELKLEEFNNRSMIKKVKESIARLFSPIL